MTLSSEQIAFFEAQGYLPAQTVLASDEVADALHAMLETKAQVEALGGSLVQPHLFFNWAYRLATHPAVLDLVEALIGPNILVHTSSLFHKQAGDARFVSWHQDGHYWELSEPNLVSTWIALSRSMPENGCLQVLPGTHARTYAHASHPNPRNMLASGLSAELGAPEAQALALPLEPGQCSLHHVNLVHGSQPNQGDTDRIGFAVRYLAVGTRQRLLHHEVVLARGVDEDGFYEHLKDVPGDDAQGFAAHAAFARKLYAFRLGQRTG